MANPTAFIPLYIRTLKSVAVTLGQMNIYRVGHPAVMSAVQEAHETLTLVLKEVDGGEINYAVKEGKLIANGQLVGALNQIPNAIVQLFNRFRLDSLKFKKGITEAEVVALCEMAAVRVEDAKTVDAAQFLAARKVTHIEVNKIVYTAIAENEIVVEKAPAGAGLGGGGKSQGASISEQLRGHSLEDSVMSLVRMVVVDPAEQVKVFDLVMEHVRNDLENKVREVTEPLKRAKTKLENEQVRTQSVLTNVAEGVVVVDDHGRVLMMNAAAEEVYGVKLKDIAGQPLAQFIKDEHMVTLAAEISTPEDRSLQGSVDVKAKGDTMRTLRASTAVVQNEAGKTVGMVSTISDVAKHKELDRMEREFVAHVTHELRAPLSAIRASLEILQGEFTGKLGTEESRMLDTAMRNTDRLNDLIKNILDFSKIESGQMSVYPKPVDPMKMTQEAVDSMQPWCTKKGLQLTLGAENGLPRVSADAGRIVQVLVNLLSNAIKFSPNGGHINVRIAKGHGPYDGFLQYSIEDNGPGIPKEEQTKIFEKFFQIAAGERDMGGTGLGLAICKALIHMHNGRLWLESDTGKGSTFFFTLPIFMPAEGADTTLRGTPWWKRILGFK